VEPVKVGVIRFVQVLEVRGEGQDVSYLVHYTGWNTRYDEWIKRARIADNLSWNPGRAKRRHQAELAGSGKKVLTKRALASKAAANRDPSSPQQGGQVGFRIAYSMGCLGAKSTENYSPIIVQQGSAQRILVQGEAEQESTFVTLRFA